MKSFSVTGTFKIYALKNKYQFRQTYRCIPMIYRRCTEPPSLQSFTPNTVTGTVPHKNFYHCAALIEKHKKMTT